MINDRGVVPEHSALCNPRSVLLELRGELEPRAQEELARPDHRGICARAPKFKQRDAYRETRNTTHRIASETMAMSTVRFTMTTKNVYQTKSVAAKSLANTSRSKSPSIPMLYIVSSVSPTVPKG